jgi:hypothetical protein
VRGPPRRREMATATVPDSAAACRYCGLTDAGVPPPTRVCACASHAHPTCVHTVATHCLLPMAAVHCP